MPIVVNPGFVWPPETEPVVSPDGRITAIVDPAHAGVLLRADFDDSVPDTPAQPEKVLRRNLTKNSSFEDGSTTGWVGSSANIISSTGYARQGTIGSRQVLMTVDSPSGTVYMVSSQSEIPVTPGQWLGVAANIGLSTGAEYARVSIGWRAGGAYAGISHGPFFKLSSTALERFTHSDLVPEGVDGAYIYIYPAKDSSGSTPPNGRTLIDAISSDSAGSSVEARGSVATYFDGSSPASAGAKKYRYVDSVSEEYTPATPFIPGKPGTVAKVRFERQDGSVVRSGNPAWAPGGYAHAYDHEATLGGGTLWRAVPILFDGTEGEPSEYVGAVIPALTDGWAWLKPVSDPNKAMLLKVEPPDLSYDGRVDTTSIAGAPRPAATWDVLEGFTTQLRSLVREKDVEEQLKALLDEGPVLAQFPACAGLPDFYFIRGKLDLEHVHWDGWPWRRYQWDVISIDRPDTTDSPMRIPDLSYDTVERDWTTYDQLKNTVTSYNKLLEP